MKNAVSIVFLFAYLLGSIQSFQVMIDFYWNREDYTQKYCVNLDIGITQCQASCYLDKLLEEKKKSEKESEIAVLKNTESTEYKLDLTILMKVYESPANTYITYNQNNYQFDFTNLIFHPPKVSPSIFLGLYSRYFMVFLRSN